TSSKRDLSSAVSSSDLRRPHPPLRHRHRTLLGSDASPPDPPVGLGRPPRATAGDRGHPGVVGGAGAALPACPQAVVVVVLCHGLGGSGGGRVVVGLPAPVRHRAHLPLPEAEPGLGRAPVAGSASGGPV